MINRCIFNSYESNTTCDLAYYMTNIAIRNCVQEDRKAVSLSINMKPKNNEQGIIYNCNWNNTIYKTRDQILDISIISHSKDRQFTRDYNQSKNSSTTDLLRAIRSQIDNGVVDSNLNARKVILRCGYQKDLSTTDLINSTENCFSQSNQEESCAIIDLLRIVGLQIDRELINWSHTKQSIKYDINSIKNMDNSDKKCTIQYNQSMLKISKSKMKNKR